MKKFIRSKMDDIEVRNRAAPDSPSSPNIRTRDPERPEVQPPLPLEPPPPDENYTLHVKQEVRDDEYESSPSEVTPNEEQNVEPLTNSTEVTITTEEPERPQVPICRDYVRGMCNRPGTCKFAHIYDVTQLLGIYTFCRNFQTSVCTFPNCKYAHATVFEEHHFYRTGILPPHVLAHHKKENVMQPPPPPPPPPPPLPKKYPINLSENTNVILTNPPPSLQNEIQTPPRRFAVKRRSNSIGQYNRILWIDHKTRKELSGFKNVLYDICCRAVLGNTALFIVSKRSSRACHLPVCSSSGDRDTNEPFAKKCKHCDVMEFRLQYNKDKVEKMLLAKDTLNKNMYMLENKSEKLSALISALRTMPSDTQSYNNGLGSSLGDEKDKTFLEQLKTFITVSNSLSAFGEDK